MFKAALEHVQDYKDAQVLYQRARKAGVKRMAIIPFQDKSGASRQYGFCIERLGFSAGFLPADGPALASVAITTTIDNRRKDSRSLGKCGPFFA